MDYLTRFGQATRRKFEEAVFPLVSSTLDERQKQDFVKNLIQEMKREGTIRKSNGGSRDAVWVLSKPASELSD